MIVCRDLKSWTKVREDWGGQGLSWGFVPTMGALHAGHLALASRAKEENGRVLVSIFVNPTQFNDPEDLRRYPRPLEKDLALLEELGADAVLVPDGSEMYPQGRRFKLSESELSAVLCGASRPGHFEGVLTVVLKLLMLSGARRAYFGEKDYQQLTLISDMVKEFFLPVEIVACPTVREPDGLAMSSRNLLLSPEHRAKAPRLNALLRSGLPLPEIRRTLEAEGFRVDYLEERFGRRFAAAYLGTVRLIDNEVL
ncbi:MAG: pantoate--beta-alanine ligase [Elusimicrobiota bacterium]|jgi:pantoate--beta-alanine ligase